MIKRTLCFTNPAYLSLKNEQLVIKLPEVETNASLPEAFKADAVRTVPIEDIGIVVLDNSRITITHGVLEKLLENNCAVVTCDGSPARRDAVATMCQQHANRAYAIPNRSLASA